MSILVIGGGITGQLVQTVVPSAVLLDWRRTDQGHRPQTRRYGANYLWEPLPGLECRSFRVVTRIDGQLPTLERIAAYKEKVGKVADTGTWATQFQSEMTGYDVVQMPTPRIRYDARVVVIYPSVQRVQLVTGQLIDYDYLVSTIPLCTLIQMVESGPSFDDDFRFKPIYVKVTPRPPDAEYASEVVYVNYLSGKDVSAYRATDRDGERHYEGLTPMGTIPTRKIVPGKIYPSTDAAPWVEWLRSQSIFCFGRFARWCPEELIHETYQDILFWATEKGID